jgi:hypothetical protein
VAASSQIRFRPTDAVAVDRGPVTVEDLREQRRIALGATMIAASVR